jgi:hypothetical protein
MITPVDFRAFMRDLEPDYCWAGATGWAPSLIPVAKAYVSAIVTGTHTGSSDEVIVLIDSNATFITDEVGVGGTVSNTTDGSSGTVVSVDSETQLTVDALLGGTDNDFDNGDAYTVVTFTEVTQEISDGKVSPNFVWSFPDVDDALYLGWTRNEYASAAFDLRDNPDHGGTGAVIAWEYWNGTAWAALVSPEDVDVLHTSGYPTLTGTSLSWTVSGDWALTDIDGDGIDMYYIRGRVSSGSYSANVVVKCVSGYLGYAWGMPNIGIAPAPGVLSFLPGVGVAEYIVGPGPSFLRRDTRTALLTRVPVDPLYINYGYFEGDAFQFKDADILNLEGILEIDPLDYSDAFGISFGYFYMMGYKDHQDDTVDGTFPDQLGFGCRFNAKYGAGGDTTAEILFSVVDEQDRVNELGPYLTLTLFENKETSPDNRGLPGVGEIFTMTDPANPSEPWRREYRDLLPVATGSAPSQGNPFLWYENDRATRIHFIGFSLVRHFLGDGTAYWKCSFYHNGRFTTVTSQVPEVPHEIMHQTPGFSYLWNMYDDGSSGPAIERTNPHFAQCPFIFYKGLNKAQWDNIYDGACRQSYGVTGYFDVVTAPAPPVRVMDHTSTNLGQQLRSLHHTNSNLGNARFVPPVITQRFRLTITGVQDSTTDVQLPMKSFSVTKSLAETQTVSFSIPFREEIVGALNDRPNGVITLEFSFEDTDGAPVAFTTYLTATQGDTSIHQGASSSSLSLNGDYIVQNRADATWDIPRKDIVREAVRGGINELVVRFNAALLPGDTVNWTNAQGAQSFVVRTVLLSATTTEGCVMVIQEDSGSG